MGDQYRKPKWFREKYGITNPTLIKWAEGPQAVRCIRTNNSQGGRRFHVADVAQRLGVKETRNLTKTTVLYARVSSAQQKDDLQRQIQDLKEQYQKEYPSHQEGQDFRVIKDIASGVNFKRPGLRALLDSIHSQDVGTVAVMHKDRLTRVGFEVLDWLFKKTNTKLVVYGKEKGEQKSDLAEDLLALTTVLVASHNGRRSAENRKRRREKAAAVENQEDQAPPCSSKKRRKPQRVQEEEASLEEDSETEHSSCAHDLE